jgi:transposase
MDKIKRRNRRLTIEEKETIVLEHLSDGATYHSLAKKYGFNKSTIAIWCKSYEKYGRTGLIGRKDGHNHHYSNDFKMMVLMKIEKGVSLSDIRVKYLIPSGTLCGWIRAYKQDGANAFINKKRRGRPPKIKDKMVKKSKQKSDKEIIDEIRKENEYLRAENDYLKKLQALTQAQGKKPKPSKN